jgi:acyl transferase domain-containing protein
MNRIASAIVFPGQGTLQRFLFGRDIAGATFREGCRAIDATNSVETVLLAASLAHYRALTSHGLRPAVLIGHSFGELTALVCAGALSLEQGAEVSRRRAAALNGYQREPGGMLQIAATRPTAEHLVALAGPSRVAVAAENGPDEIVISGTTAALDSARALAREWRVPCGSLKARWALHCSHVMRSAAAELRKELGSVAWQPIQVPVFSPILGRHYTASDDLADCLSRHLVLPVEFADAIRLAARSGVERFIECGPLRGLGRAISRTIAEASATVQRTERSPFEATLPRCYLSQRRPSLGKSVVRPVTEGGQIAGRMSQVWSGGPRPVPHDAHQPREMVR